jgi:hypothetical protein
MGLYLYVIFKVVPKTMSGAVILNWQTTGIGLPRQTESRACFEHFVALDLDWSTAQLSRLK